MKEISIDRVIKYLGDEFYAKAFPIEERVIDSNRKSLSYKDLLEILRQMQQIIECYKVTVDGSSYITDNVKDLIEHLSNDLDAEESFFPDIEMVEMTHLELKTLPEFQGY